MLTKIPFFFPKSSHLTTMTWNVRTNCFFGEPVMKWWPTDVRILGQTQEITWSHNSVLFLSFYGHSLYMDKTYYWRITLPLMGWYCVRDVVYVYSHTKEPADITGTSPALSHDAVPLHLLWNCEQQKNRTACASNNRNDNNVADWTVIFNS